MNVSKYGRTRVENSTEECEQLLTLSENRPCLYDTKSKYYKDKNERMDTFS